MSVRISFFLCKSCQEYVYWRSAVPQCVRATSGCWWKRNREKGLRHQDTIAVLKSCLKCLNFLSFLTISIILFNRNIKSSDDHQGQMIGTIKMFKFTVNRFSSITVIAFDLTLIFFKISFTLRRNDHFFYWCWCFFPTLTFFSDLNYTCECHFKL